MHSTKLSYLDDTYCFANLCKVQSGGEDEKGHFLIFDHTIYYPGGGGQPKDIAQIERNGNEWKITSADFNGGAIKHYVEGDISSICSGDTLAMSISRHSRLFHAMYHTAGHWIASAVTENLQLSWIPLKGYHYPDGAYIEFEGDKSSLNETLIDDLRFALMVDAQYPLKINAEIVSFDNSERLKTANLPKNFVPNPDKPLRLVRMENYRSVPCGGTHIISTSEIKTLTINKIFLKNGMIRISYNCVPWEMPIS